MTTQKRRLIDLILIAAFLAGIFLPLAFTSLRWSSEVEKRRLAMFPGLPLSLDALLKFPRGFETFYNDHFGFRDPLVQLHNVLDVRLGVSPTEKVLIGKDHWFFYANPMDGNEIADYRHLDPLTKDELAAWQANLEQRYHWLQSRGITYLFVIVPNKTTIYGEYLPDTINQVAGQSHADQFIAFMSTHTAAPILDLRPVLLAAKGSGPLLYDKTGTHWNAWGANIAQHAIATTLAAKMPTIRPVLYAAADFHEQWGAADNDLTRMMAVGNTFDQPSPALTVTLRACERQVVENLADQPLSEAPFQTTCPVADGSDALIFRDSATIALQPYLSTYFRRATYVWIDRPDMASLQAYVEAMRPQVVIEERGERHLKEGDW